MDTERSVHFSKIVMILAVLLLAMLACNGGAALVTPTVQGATPAAQGATQANNPVTIDLSTIDVCKAISVDDITSVLGRKLVSDPKPIHLNDNGKDSGCEYSAGKDAAGNAYFVYLVIAPITDYQDTRKTGSAVTPISGLGDEAFTTNGADALQLWVLVKDKGAVVAAIGDQPNLTGEEKLVPLLLALLPS
jgi:hypothetical protein